MSSQDFPPIDPSRSLWSMQQRYLTPTASRLDTKPASLVPSTTPLDFMQVIYGSPPRWVLLTSSTCKSDRVPILAIGGLWSFQAKPSAFTLFYFFFGCFYLILICIALLPLLLQPRKDKKIIIIKNKLPSPLLSFSIPERTENVSLDVTQYTYREMRLRCNHAHHTIERTRSIPSFFFVEQKSNQQKMKKEEECP